MNDRARQRVFVLRVLVVSLVATLLGRLWYVQVLSGPTYRAQAAANQVRQLVTPAPRGMIVDDEGRSLANDRSEMVVTVQQDVLGRQKDKGAAVLARLSPIVGEPVADLRSKIRLCGGRDAAGAVITQPCYAGSPYAAIPVKAFDPNDAAQLQRALTVEERSEDFPGVGLSEQQVRQYPLGSVAGHELGYLAPIDAQQLTLAKYKGYQDTDLIGQNGLEQQYDRQLRGTDAVRTVSVDAAGNVTGTVGQTQPVAGATLVTHLDAGLQQAVDRELATAISTAQGKGQLATTAAAVVMDVHTGAVLALGSLPNYDPNQFTGGISTKAYAALADPNASNPLISRAYSAAYPPGSTLKATSSATILHDGLGSADQVVDCGPGLRVGNQFFKNFEGEALGGITLSTALAKSCDSYYYKFGFDAWLHDGGLRLTPQTRAVPLHEYFVKMAKAFGYGAPTGIDLPNETAGVLFDRHQTAVAIAAEQKQACIGAHTHPGEPAREAADKTLCDTPAAQAQVLTAGDAVDFAIGQGGQVNVTLLQQAVAYAAIANGGTLVQPQIAKALIGANGVATPIKPVVRGKVPVSAANLASIRDGLRAVVTRGTGAGLFDASLDAAGKTGTADIAAEGDKYGLFHQPESWFASYQPASNPQYVVIGMVEHGGQGAYAAAPLVANIYRDMYGLDGHKPVWPGGKPPTALPKVSVIGQITRPQTGIIGVHRTPGLPGGQPDPKAVENQRAQEAAARAKAAAAAAAAGAGA